MKARRINPLLFAFIANPFLAAERVDTLVAGRLTELWMRTRESL
jgi:hypothetical protein